MASEPRLSLSDASYRALLRVAAITGKPPEQWAEDCLTEELWGINKKPLTFPLARCLRIPMAGHRKSPFRKCTGLDLTSQCPADQWKVERTGC